jgi:hypothetical protein
MPKRSQRKSRVVPFTGMPEFSDSLNRQRGAAGEIIRDRDYKRMQLADMGRLEGQSIYRPARVKPTRTLTYADTCAGRTTLSAA